PIFATLAQWQSSSFVNYGCGFDSCRWLSKDERMNRATVLLAPLKVVLFYGVNSGSGVRIPPPAQKHRYL
ncbi:MAG: hypothetical protein UV51_C0013G0001, partial [Candidatus Woesebacteria bacterium GW2011_GWC1_42_9]